jgi:hypothetical protein
MLLRASALAALALAALAGAAAAAYAPAVRVGEITAPELAEISGLAAARVTSGRLWVVNDSGNAAKLYALDMRGGLVASVAVEGAENRDWEDLAAGPGRGGRPALYIGDIGDNDHDRDDLAVYRVPEPRVTGVEAVAAERFRFRYPDGRHDAEALAVDPRSGRVHVVTKGLGGARVYRFPLPLRAGVTVTLERVRAPALASVSLVTGASWSPDGRRLAVRSYFTAYELRGGFAAPAERVRIALERQGEAIAYTADGRALLTTSERLPAPLHRLARR